jgi:hypothetical protein
VLTGACGAGSGTTAVGDEWALVDPPALVAVTVASIVEPMSLEATV